MNEPASKIVSVKVSEPASKIVNVVRSKSCAELLQETRRLLARVTYKPGWALTATAPDEVILSKPWRPWEVTVGLDYRVMSLEDPFCSVLLTTAMVLTESHLAQMLRDEQLVYWVVQNLIRRAELHEMDEWLKLDGKCVTNPHPELRVKAPNFVPAAAHDLSPMNLRGDGLKAVERLLGIDKER